MIDGPSALLAMDFQNGVVARYPGGPTAVERVSRALSHARNSSVLVIYVRVAFRAGHPEVSPNNRLFTRIVDSGDLDEMTSATQIDPAIAPAPGDIVVTKRRVSAFTGSDLEVILRAQRIDTLVLAGISTSGVVLSTVRDAADRDFNITVLSDACTDLDPDTHRLLLDSIFPRQALVTPVEDWIRSSAAGVGS
jgi:nicotinamidase-related amidase